jgi:hypothetical protein
VWCACFFFFTMFPRVFEASRRLWSHPLTSTTAATAFVAIGCELVPADVYDTLVTLIPWSGTAARLYS